jgi:hypothetical protein
MMSSSRVTIKRDRRFVGRFCVAFLTCAAWILVTSSGARVSQSAHAPVSHPKDNLSTSVPSFTDITRQAGVAYKITNGDKLSEYLIDINGEGACFIDYNNDGFQDIYLVNGSSRKSEAAGLRPHDYLLRNNGNGTFTDVTREAHIGGGGWHSGCAVGDYNNDGYPDIYITSFGPNKLYRNNGDGTFTDVAEAAGVADPHWPFPKWSMGAAFGDYDQDGNLDLYVANFAKFDPRHLPPRPGEADACKMRDVPIACPPDNYEGEQGILYHNNGDGTFTDMSQRAGIVRKDPGRSFGVVFGDFSNNGRQDIYVVNDSGPNFYYVNNGDGTFTDASWISGLAVDGAGNPQGSMGVAVGDYNNDGLMDIFITNWIEQNNTLYENQGAQQFQDRTSVLGLSPLGFEYCGWGTGFVDFDNDGWLDLWITYGHTNEQLEMQNPARRFAEPNFFLRNVEGHRFVDVSEAAGLRKLPAHSGRGAAFADIDNDGDVDVLLINKNAIPTLLRNDGGNARHWLVVRTEGVRSNRSGIGARITVTTAGKRRIFDVRGSESYLSGNDLRVHIGMGDEQRADGVEIRWPSRQVDRYTNVPVDTFYLAREGSGLGPDPRVHRSKIIDRPKVPKAHQVHTDRRNVHMRD